MEQEHTTYCKMETTIREMAHKINDMHDRMFVGNGQPAITVRLDRLEQDHKRSKWLTNTAIGGAITTAIGLIGTWIYAHLHVK